MMLSWMRVAIRFFHHSTFAKLWGSVLLLGLYSALAVAKELSPWEAVADIPANTHALFGVALGILLVFRTNTAYDRWWEGRKLWGQLVNVSRNLVVKVQTLVDTVPKDKGEFGALVTQFAVALKDHLRGSSQLQKLAGFEKHPARPENVPLFLIGRMYEMVSGWRKGGQLDGYSALMLDPEARAFADVCGACERIRKTPLVRSYLFGVRFSILLYLTSLPWALAHDFVWWTVPVTMLVAWVLLGLELIAEEVEEPFGRDYDDLPLEEICRTIEDSVRQVLGPPPAGKETMIDPAPVNVSVPSSSHGTLGGPSG